MVKVPRSGMREPSAYSSGRPHVSSTPFSACLTSRLSITSGRTSSGALGGVFRPHAGRTTKTQRATAKSLISVAWAGVGGGLQLLAHFRRRRAAGDTTPRDRGVDAQPATNVLPELR